MSDQACEIHRYRCDCGEGELHSISGTPTHLLAATCRTCGGSLAYDNAYTVIARNLHFSDSPEMRNTSEASR